MRDGYVNSEEASSHTPQQQISGTVPTTRNGNLQLRGPPGQLGQAEETVSDVIVPPIRPIAGTAKGMVTPGVHRLVAT